MPDIKSLATNPKTSVEGVLVDYYGVKLQVAREGNPDHLAAQQRIYLENASAIQSSSAELEAAKEGSEEYKAAEKKGDELANRIESQILAEGILKDWKNVTENGKELAYTPELGAKYLADPEYDDMRQFILRVSRNRAQFRSKDVDAATEMVKAQSDS